MSVGGSFKLSARLHSFAVTTKQKAVSIIIAWYRDFGHAQRIRV